MPEINEIKGLLEDQKKGIQEALDKVTKSHEDVDGRVSKIAEDLKEYGKESAETKDAFQKSVERVEKAEDLLDGLIEKMQKAPGNTPVQKSLGEVAASSEALKNYSGGTVEIAKMQGSMFKKDITSAAASAGVTVEADRIAGIMAEPDQELTVRDLLMTIPTSSNSIEWARELLFTNNAGPQTAEGATKPQSDVTFELQNTAVKTLAHWFAASRQILADSPSLRAYIDQKGRYGLKLKEEEQLLFGDGTGGNIQGIVPQATAYDNALNVTGDSAVDKMRRAILQATLAKYPVSGFVLNPADWAGIELTKTSDNAYLFANPVNGTIPRLWGKRVVESVSMTADNFLTGAFNMGATLWDREMMSVRVAEQHGDFFVQNMVAILIEERLALTVERPAAFITGTVSTA